MPRKKGLNNFYMSTRIISDTNTATKRGNLAWISRNVGQKAFIVLIMKTRRTTQN